MKVKIKSVLFCIFISVACNLHAQKLPAFFNQNDNITKWYIYGQATDLDKEISKLNQDTFGWVLNNIRNGSSAASDYFHFIDFDTDGIRDIVYTGLLGGESHYVIFLRGNGKSYEKIIGLAGKIVWANMPNQGEPMRFRLYNYACCMGRVDFIEYYSPRIRNNKFEYILENREAYINETVFPESKMKQPVLFETINDEYKLRLSPKIDNETEYWGTDEKGNEIATYPKGSTGVAYSEVTDETGRIWWFVKMTNNKPSLGMFMNGGNNEEPYSSYGWISSRYVNIIK